MESNQNLSTTSEIKPQAPALYGLYDVDGTVLNLQFAAGKGFLYNEALLDAYKELGIRDIRIFTNMRLQTLADEFHEDYEAGIPASRYQVIEELTKRGFIVHEVYTPADMALDKGPGGFYTTMYLPQYERFKSGELNYRSQVEDMEFQGAVENFKEAWNKATAPDMQDKFLREVLKIEDVKAVRGFNIKGPLYAYLLNHTKSSGMAIYADDEESALKTVEQVAQVLGQENNLVTVHVDDRKDFNEEDYKHHKAVYKERILESVRKKAPEQFQAMINYIFANLKQAIAEFDTKSIHLDKIELYSLSDDQKIALIRAIAKVVDKAIPNETIPLIEQYNFLHVVYELSNRISQNISEVDTDTYKALTNFNDRMANKVVEVEKALKSTRNDDIRIKILENINKDYKNYTQGNTKISLFTKESEKYKKIEKMQQDFMTTLNQIPDSQLSDSRIQAILKDKQGIVFSKSSRIFGGTIEKDVIARLNPPKKLTPGKSDQK